MSSTNHRCITVFAVLLLVLSLAFAAHAEWAVELESKSVPAGATDVTMDIIASWDYDMSSFVLPLVVREIDPGAFWTGVLPYDTNGHGGYHPYTHGVTWHWDPNWADFVERVIPGIGKSRSLWCDPPADTLYDGLSPDNFSIMASAGLAFDLLPPLQDAVVITLTFDVSAIPGQFEFDTACFLIGQTGLEMSNWLGIIQEASFTKGVITITGCYCPEQGDCDGNAAIDIADLTYMINYAILGDGPPPGQSPFCPAAVADWNCDGRVNIIDITRLAGHLFRWPRPEPCDPCEIGAH